MLLPEGGNRAYEKHFFNQNKKFWEKLINFFPWYDTDCTEDDLSNNSSITAYVFVAVVTFLLSCCLAMKGDTHTERLMGGISEVRR
jgi:hypothetical protein